MRLGNKIKQIEERMSIGGKYCRCRSKGRNKPSIEAETFRELMTELYSGACAVCSLPHVPAGYGFWSAWMDTLKEIDSEGLRAVNAELAASNSFPAVMVTKKCEKCGSSITDTREGCRYCNRLAELDRLENKTR